MSTTKKRNMGHVKFTNICTSATLKSHAKSFEEVVTGNFFVPVLIKIYFYTVTTFSTYKLKHRVMLIR